MAKAAVVARPAPAPVVVTGPCTFRTPRCPDATDHTKLLRACCRSHVISLSKVIAAAFDAAGVRYWVDYGTLLGAVRNPMTTRGDYPWLPQDRMAEGPIPPGIAPHDKDADWGVWGADWPKAYKAARRVAADHRYSLIARPHIGQMKVRLSQQNQTNLDLFFWYERPNGVHYRKRYATRDDCKGRDLPAGLLLPLTTVEWEGMRFPAPHDPEKVLEHRYGPAWRTPIPANHDGVRRP